MQFEKYDALTLPVLLANQVDEFANRPLLKLGSEVLTYAAVGQQVEKLAAGLADLGLGNGQRIGLLLPNIPEFVIAMFAAARIGLILVPINIRRSQDEIKTRLAKTGASAVIASSPPGAHGFTDHLSVLDALHDELPDLHQIITMDKKQDGFISWQTLFEGPGDIPELDIATTAPCAIIHTLGHSGEPRGAMLTHGSLIGNAARLAAQLEATPNDIFLGAVPFSNTFGMTATILACVISGGLLICMPHYTPGNALDLIAQEGVTIHNGVPTMFAMELNHPSFQKEDVKSLRTGLISGAPCPSELAENVHKKMGCQALIAYGLTEAGPGVTATRLTDGPVTALETVGRPLPGVEVKVVDSLGVELGKGEEGELCVRSPNIMLAYWEEPEETHRVLDDDGWLHTGDLAVLDPNGPVRIIGRKDDVIIRSGYKIYPKMVEMVLRMHPAIKETVVVGITDLIFGEMICACVVKQKDTEPTISDLKLFLEEHLPEYAVPDKIIFFNELPRRSSGVVRRNYLQDLVRIRGRAWKFGQNIDTDAIIPARRCNTADPQELALYCMEDADDQFVNKMQRGDLIIAETNFGCGSSREVAPLAIKAAGVSAVIAKSFARIFFRNAINIGLPILESPEAVDGIQQGDEIEVEPALGVIRNLTQQKTYRAEPFPDFLQKIINQGGLLAYVEDRLEKQSRAN